MFDIAIVGLGLMGGSLALALRASSSLRVLGIDPDAHTRLLAQERQVTLEVTDDLSRVKEAGLIVLATPVRTIVELLPRVGELAQDGALILDIGSTKRTVVQAMEQLPTRLRAVGGHPLCGKETHGIESADAQLFRDKIFVVTPISRTTSTDIERVSRVLAPTGAHVIEIDAEQHDYWLGLTSHLPYMVAVALVLTAPEQNEALWSRLVASGFRDTSRLAASDEVMMRDILLTNHDNVAEWLKRYARRISELADAVEHRDISALSDQLIRAAEKRRQLYPPNL